MASATADVAPQVLRIFTNDLNTREGLERLGWARHHLLLSEGEKYLPFKRSVSAATRSSSLHTFLLACSNSAGTNRPNLCWSTSSFWNRPREALNARRAPPCSPVRRSLVLVGLELHLEQTPQTAK